MRRAESWQTGEVAGPKKALVITKTSIVNSMITHANRPIIIAGSEVTKTKFGNTPLSSYVLQIARKYKLPIVATAHIVNEFLKHGYKNTHSISSMDIGNRLLDTEWSGLDGKGPYDLVIFIGFPYYLEWNIQSSMKHYGKDHLKTISLGRFYQPHASWSFVNIPEAEWENQLKEITALETKKTTVTKKGGK